MCREQRPVRELSKDGKLLTFVYLWKSCEKFRFSCVLIHIIFKAILGTMYYPHWSSEGCCWRQAEWGSKANPSNFQLLPFPVTLQVVSVLRGSPCVPKHTGISLMNTRESHFRLLHDCLICELPESSQKRVSISWKKGGQGFLYLERKQHQLCRQSPGWIQRPEAENDCALQHWPCPPSHWGMNHWGYRLTWDWP